jgi:hypothetical protein
MERNWLGYITFIVGLLVIVLLIIIIPHWCRSQGEIASKNHIPNWTVHHEAYTETVEGHYETDISIDFDGNLTTDSDWVPTHDVFHDAWDEYHPDVYTLIVEGKDIAVDAPTYEQAQQGDFWVHDGFYGSKLLKMEH